MKKYVDVIVPLPIASQYTYSLPSDLEESVQEGCRVVVSFGRKKFYTAIVTKVHYAAPEGYETKDIEEVLDASPILLPKQFEFWEWLSTYYLCTLGDVYKAAMPSGMKLESETVVVYNEEFEATQPLSENEQRLLDLLSSDKEQCVTQLQRAIGLKNVLPVVKRLLEKEAIFVKEDLKRSYKPRTETRVRLVNRELDDAGMMTLFNELSRAKKQLAVLMKYVELSGWTSRSEYLKEVSKKELLEKSGATTTIFNGLVDKGIFEVYYQEIGRLNKSDVATFELNALNPSQQGAFSAILESFQQKNVCLLHGVTSSGKTEIYIHLIQEALKQGKQVLYLLPEIALTTQITERLKRVFGKRLGVYHSKFPDAERVEIWKKQLGNEEYDVILGVRSSIFLPFKRLGLVIVDEEHENTYKQQDPAPRYHARSSAIMLASMYGAKVLLGTATPSVETYFNATNGKYGLVELKESGRSCWRAPSRPTPICSCSTSRLTISTSDRSRGSRIFWRTGAARAFSSRTTGVSWTASPRASWSSTTANSIPARAPTPIFWPRRPHGNTARTRRNTSARASSAARSNGCGAPRKPASAATWAASNATRRPPRSPPRTGSA